MRPHALKQPQELPGDRDPSDPPPLFALKEHPVSRVQPLTRVLVLRAHERDRHHELLPVAQPAVAVHRKEKQALEAYGGWEMAEAQRGVEDPALSLIDYPARAERPQILRLCIGDLL